MRSGNPVRRARAVRGFTYLGLLVLLALQGAALAALGRHVGTAVQRDKEAELLFRGEQIVAAIASYHAAREPHTYPASLDDLLSDRRGDTTRHHLRRLWRDPFTGQADWELIRDTAQGGAEGRLLGVRSRSPAARLRTDGPLAVTDGPPRVADWHFTHSAAPVPDTKTKTEGEPS